MRLKHVLSVMLLGLSPGLLMSAAQSAPEKHAISPDDIVNLLQPGDPQISHDGSRIAYTIGTPQPMGKPPLSRIWQISTRVGSSAHELPAPDGASDRSPQWSVGGEQLAFLSDRPASGSAAKPAPGGVQVWQLAAGSDVPVQVSHSGTDVQSFAFSPDRKRLAYLAQDPASAADKARAARQDDAHEVERPQRFSRLWIQELAGGQPRALTPAAMQVHDFNWSPDGRTLALRVSSGTTLNDYWYDSQVLIFDIGTATVMKTLSTRASAHPLQFSPDGRRLLYGELGPHGMTATLYLQPLAGGARVALAPAWGGTLWAARWLDDAALIGQGQRGVRGALLRINAASGAETEIARPRFPYQSFSVASTGAIAFLGSRDDMPPEIWSWDGNTLHELTRSHAQVEQWSRGQVRELNWRSSRDAREIHGVLVTPADWVPGTPLPTLVQIHGGPAWAWWSGWLGSWHDWGQLLASHGYAVLLPNPRGSEGQGRAFTESTRNDWGGADFQDVLDGIDMLEREGVIDPARLAIGGWSYGGYLSAWAVTQSKRFRTAIVGAGITDIGAMALTTDTPDYLPGYFGDPLRNRDRYDAHSPIRQVENVAVPVLILHGEADKRVPVSQGQMFYRALRMRGVPVEMVSYPRGPHWFHEREHQRDLQQRVLDWLDARLLNQPAASQPAPR